MNDIVSIYEIKTLLVNTSEEIHKKDLLDFCKTQFTLNDYSLLKDDFLYAIFIEEANKYFIFSSQNRTSKYFTFELFINKLLEFKLSDTYILLRFTDTIYLYKNLEIYYFQALDYELSDDEIFNLIYEKLNINVNKIINLKDEDLSNKSKVKTLLNINSKRSVNYFRLYVFYLFILILTLLLYVYYETTKVNDKKIIIDEYKYLSKKLDDISKISNNKLIIQKIDYDELLKLQIHISKDIYEDELVHKLKKDFKIISSKYDDKLDLYSMELYVK